MRHALVGLKRVELKSEIFYSTDWFCQFFCYLGTLNFNNMADIDSFAADSNATLIQSFSLLVNSLDHHANDLRDVSKLRCSPDGVDQTELVVLEKRIRTMEHTFKALRQHLKGESEAIKEVQNLQNVVNEQTDHIQKICGNLPQHLPQQNFGSSQAAPEPQRSVVDDSSNVENVEHVPSKPKGRTKTRRGRKSVTDRIPKLRYLTVDEFSSVPSYIRGRLSLNKVRHFALSWLSTVLSTLNAMVCVVLGELCTKRTSGNCPSKV